MARFIVFAPRMILLLLQRHLGPELGLISHLKPVIARPVSKDLDIVGVHEGSGNAERSVLVGHLNLVDISLFFCLWIVGAGDHCFVLDLGVHGAQADFPAEREALPHLEHLELLVVDVW